MAFSWQGHRNDATFFAASPPEPIVDQSTGQRRVGRDGAELSRTRIVAIADGEVLVFWLRLSGAIPSGIVPNTAVRIEDLTIAPWEMGDRSGITYAGRLVPVSASRPTADSKPI
jgi:hypothetical protein